MRRVSGRRAGSSTFRYSPELELNINSAAILREDEFCRESGTNAKRHAKSCVNKGEVIGREVDSFNPNIVRLRSIYTLLEIDLVTVHRKRDLRGKNMIFGKVNNKLYKRISTIKRPLATKFFVKLFSEVLAV